MCAGYDCNNTVAKNKKISHEERDRTEQHSHHTQQNVLLFNTQLK
jgi:hypothetical protein